MTPIRYVITAKHPAAHLFEVTLTVDDPDLDGQQFALPVWIPGSYMVREFARNIVTLVARSGSTGRKIGIEKIDKHSWRAQPCVGPLIVTYEIYAWDLSVRAAHLDDHVGFFNGSSVFLAVVGRGDAPCHLDIQRPAGEAFTRWRVATALQEARGTRRYSFGEYRAANYDELIDQPVTLGDFALGHFTACGVPHDVVISGHVPNLDMARLTADLQPICEAQISMFEPRTRRAPMTRYVFMTMAVSQGYGGLEHRASTALICNRGDLPAVGVSGKTDGYRTYLGLCSHEYFHTWNVKRIKPAAFVPYDLSNENYTKLLWLFEGFTSYYDDLMLLRAGAIDSSQYLALLGKTVAGVLRGSGRRKQSVAESSFDAWTKYYRQDENAANAIVSYYTKGSLVALSFDLAIRAQTGNCKSLDDVMRALWVRYGRDFYNGQARGIGEQDVLPLINEATGVDLRSLYRLAVEGTADLPLTALFDPFGIAVEARFAAAPVSLGVRIQGGADCTLAAVHEDGAAQKAGLSAGDVVIACDGLRVASGNLDALLARYRPRDKVLMHAFRRDELKQFVVTLDAPDVQTYTLTPSLGGNPARRLREAWLAGRRSAASTSVSKSRRGG
ncbi:MAG: M61 family metallopeptidase [Janthinobacterium lividum]